ncbi:MAG: biopolymer transporter ExbD [Proteobacteria bacterium]|nr:biopolymer transporter ExbD [Pseudomonadota bacterium]
MAFSSNDSGGPMASINVTPLVDVMLVLLIIFMITTPLMRHKVQVKLPNAVLRHKPDDPPRPPVTVTVKADGSIFWNDDPVDQGVLDAKLAGIAPLLPQPEVDVRADKNTHYGTIWKVVKTAQANGILKIGFVSAPKGDGH